MSAIIFAGCSFTHGHGLWYYSIEHYKEYFRSGDLFKISTERGPHHFHYKNILRFPRLVAQELECFELVRIDYSGNDLDSILFIDYVFNFDKYYNKFLTEHFKIDEVKHIVFQTSYPNRSGYEIEKDCLINIIKYEDLEKYGFSSLDEFNIKLRKQLFDKIKNCFEFYENKGIKCFILNLTNDYNDLIEKDNYMLNRKVFFNYMDKNFSSLQDMFEFDPTLLIINDHEYFGEITPNDGHPSKKFHKIIAENIVKKIKG